MTYKIIAILFFVIAAVGTGMCLIALWAYFVYVQNGLHHTAKATDLLDGVKGIAVVSAMFFFIGRILYRKWKRSALSVDSPKMRTL